MKVRWIVVKITKWEYAELENERDHFFFNGKALLKKDPFGERKIYSLLEALNFLGEDGWELALKTKVRDRKVYIMKLAVASIQKKTF